MAFSSCLSHPLISFKPIGPPHTVGWDQRLIFAHKSMNTERFGRQVPGVGTDLQREWSFIGGSKVRPQVATFIRQQKGFRGWQTEIASNMFTVGTIAVLPFYALMILAPKAELTKKSMESSIPYVVIGLLYAFLMYLSWTPDKLGLLFSGEYLLPELYGISKMFTSDMTLASAWIHFLVVDLFAARFFTMVSKMKSKLDIQFLFASFPVPSDLLLMSSQKDWQKAIVELDRQARITTSRSDS